VTPRPDGQAGAAKRSTANVPLGVELSVPLRVVAEPSVVAEVTTGKFWRSFGPASPSPGSLAVGPSPFRSMLRPTLAEIRLPRMALARVVAS
jgi:hypothetical protein